MLQTQTHIIKKYYIQEHWGQGQSGSDESTVHKHVFKEQWLQVEKDSRFTKGKTPPQIWNKHIATRLTK